MILLPILNYISLRRPKDVVKMSTGKTWQEMCFEDGKRAPDAVAQLIADLQRKQRAAITGIFMKEHADSLMELLPNDNSLFQHQDLLDCFLSGPAVQGIMKPELFAAFQQKTFDHDQRRALLDVDKEKMQPATLYTLLASCTDNIEPTQINSDKVKQMADLVAKFYPDAAIQETISFYRKDVRFNIIPDVLAFLDLLAQRTQETLFGKRVIFPF